MAKRKRYKPPQNFANQVNNAIVIRLISRKRGATVEQIARALDWQPHTVRSVISRLGDVGIEISRMWLNGHIVYSLVDRFTGAKDRTKFSKRQAAALKKQGGLKPTLPRKSPWSKRSRSLASSPCRHRHAAGMMTIAATLALLLLTTARHHRRH